MHRFSCGDTWFWFVIIRVMLSEIVCRMLMNVVERCLRDVWVMLRNVCDMSERCFWVILWELLKIFWGDVAWVLLGVLKAVERCFSSVNSLTTVSQTSLTLPFPQQSQQQFSNILSTFPLPQQSLNSLSAISQQTWFLAPITQQYLQTLSLSLNLLSTLLFPQHSRNKPIPSSIPSSFQQNSHRPLPQHVFWIQSPYVILGKQVNTCTNHS